MKLILASTSSYRADQLTRVGLEFQSVAPKFDEAGFKKAFHGSPRQLAQTLATRKVESLRLDFPDHILLGGDQVAVFHSQIFDKPEIFERAVEQLKKLSGQTHQLFTAMTLIYKGRIWEHVDHTKLSMRSLSEKALTSYVQFDNPLDCAGAYKFESGGVALFQSIQTQDPSAIAGIPLIKLVDILGHLGYPLCWKPFERKTPESI